MGAGAALEPLGLDDRVVLERQGDERQDGVDREVARVGVAGLARDEEVEREDEGVEEFPHPAALEETPDSDVAEHEADD